MRLIRLSVLAAIIALLALAACSDDDDDKAVNSGNHAPEILSVTAEPDTFVAYTEQTTVTATAQDADGDPLTYSWQMRGSALQAINSWDNHVELTNCCPVTATTSAWVVSLVSDGQGGNATDSVQVWILPGSGS